MLFILCGVPGLRIGEALGIEIDKHLSADFSTISIRQKARHCKIEARLKTPSARKTSGACGFAVNETSGAVVGCEALFHLNKCSSNWRDITALQKDRRSPALRASFLRRGP